MRLRRNERSRFLFRSYMKKLKKHSEITFQSWPEANQEPVKKTEPCKRNIPELVEKALEAFEARLNTKDLKPTLTEYLKLLQVQKEVAQEEDGPREITVTWVEPELDYSEE